MDKLLYYIPPYVNAAEKFLKQSGIFSKEEIEKWEQKKAEHETFKRTFGPRNNQPQAIDREEKVNYLFDTKAHTKIPKMEYKELKSFNELMIERATELKNLNKTIQLFWSGGVDSTAALFALREVCPNHVMVQTSPDAINESPEMFKKYVKDLDHNIHMDNNLLGVADPNKYIVTTACCADQMYNTNGHGRLTVENTDPKQHWYERNRFGRSHRTFRWFLNTELEEINVDNIKPFYDCSYIEQHFINMILDGRLTFTDKSDEHYKEHKKDIRKFLMKYEYDFGMNKLGRQDIRHSDKELMKAVNFNSGKSKEVPQWKNMAITAEGKVIRREKESKNNYIEYGFKTFLPYLANFK